MRACERDHRHHRAPAGAHRLRALPPGRARRRAARAVRARRTTPGLHGWATGVPPRRSNPISPTGCARRTSCGGPPSRTSSCRSRGSRGPAATAARAPPSPRSWTSSTSWTTSSSWPPPWSSPARCRTARASPLAARPTPGAASGRWSWPPRAGPRQVGLHRGGCWTTRRRTGLAAPAPGGLRRGLLRRHLVPACAPSSPPTPGTRPSCCAARAWPRRWHAVSPALTLDEDAHARITRRQTGRGRTTAVDPADGAGLLVRADRASAGRT